MRKVFTDEAWDDYLYWSTHDKRILKRINALIKDIERSGAPTGVGKPEPLRGNLSGWWSRRIDGEHRIVYRVLGDGDARCLEILQCRTHYGDR
ncbi:MAG: Txe/YoeB family addiction module toxin [Bifidobacterium sp.]|nr:Txe/YoeB family addiction module toxin [Bifidobacterium sp.]